MNLGEELLRSAPRPFIRGRFVGERGKGVHGVAKFDETGARVAWVLGATDATLDRATESEWREFEPRYRKWLEEIPGAELLGMDLHELARAQADRLAAEKAARKLVT